MSYKLYFFLIGCKLRGRHTEQHDIFFGIGERPADLIPALQDFWPEADNLHLDCWREVTNVNGHQIKVVLKNEVIEFDKNLTLFFMNLGGYKPGEFEEFHFRTLCVATSTAEAIKQSKKTSFFKTYGFKGATSHIDEKYGVDVDEIYAIDEILSEIDKAKYSIVVTNEISDQIDELHLGYTTLSKLKSQFRL